MSKSTYLIHSNEYKNWIFDESHPTQGRRFNNARDLFITSAEKEGIAVVEVLPRLATATELLRVHTPGYIDEVLNQHLSTEWDGQREDLANLAQLFVGGTLITLDCLLQGKTNLAIHFPGSKHHAQADHSSGFCIFNDFAIAADIASKEHGKNILILDIDAHHGDGVECLTADNLKVITFSIHEDGIFPGTGYEDKAGHFYNRPLPSDSGDDELLTAVDEFILMAKDQMHSNNWQVDLLFITCGADGHKEDRLSTLQYSVQGYEQVAKKLREAFSTTPILLGGAGGYLPDTRTPEVWSRMAIALA